MIAEILGPATLAYLEFTLAVLEPAGLDAGSVLESMALLNGFVINLVRSELADREVVLPPLAEGDGELLDLALGLGDLAEESETASRTIVVRPAGTDRAAVVLAGG